MRRAAIVLALLSAQAGAAPAYRAQMTGAQLVRDMQADPSVGDNPARRERAMGYIDGVMDASAGERWCPTGKTIPHELNYLVVEAVAAMPKTRQQGAAAALIQSVLAEKYPCKSHGAKP
jgi:hypothetical protein